MDAAKLNQLKQFVEQCKSNPSILDDPSLSFFQDYLKSLGANLKWVALDLLCLSSSLLSLSINLIRYFSLSTLSGLLSLSHQMVAERAFLLSRSGDEDEDHHHVFDKIKGASFTGSVFNLSCTIVGAGIMRLPSTLKLLGVVLGVALIIIAAILIEASIEMLLRFSKSRMTFSYGDVMGDAFGTFGWKYYIHVDSFY